MRVFNWFETLFAHGKPDRRLCHVYFLAAVRWDGKTYTHPLLRERCNTFLVRARIRYLEEVRVDDSRVQLSTWVQTDEMLSSPYVGPWRIVVGGSVGEDYLPPSPHADNNNTPDDLPDSLPLSSHRRGIMIDLGSKTDNPSEF